MTGLAFSANALGQIQANAVQHQIDIGLGYPVAGRDIGDGIHAPASQSVTTSYVQPFQQADNTWAYPVDATSQPLLTPAQQLALTTVTPPPPQQVVVAQQL